MTPLKQRVDDLREAERAATDDLDALWADLEPVTVEEILGAWRVADWEVGFRGETTATMVYDRMPDVRTTHKLVDDATLMGIMNGKLESAFGVSDLYYFWLERDDR
jgi:hypothetical protein